MEFTIEQLSKVIESADEVITALDGTNEDIHPEDSKKMCEAWDHLNDRAAPPQVVKRLAEIALATLTAPTEPVYQYRIRNGYNGQVTEWQTIRRDQVDFVLKAQPLNAEFQIIAPPAPVVPDEIRNRFRAEGLAELLKDARDYSPLTAGQWETLTKNWHQMFVGLSGEGDACSAAMLQGAEPRQAVRSEHAEWSQSTFGDVGPVGPLKHLSKEALEAAAEPGDLSEWADMQFLLWDAQRRAGITDEQITLAMIEKLAINKARDWPEPKDGEPRLHIKKAPQQEDQQIKK